MHLPFHSERAAHAASGFGELLLKCASESFAEITVGKSGSHRYLSEAGEAIWARPNRVEPRKKRLCHCTGRFFS